MEALVEAFVRAGRNLNGTTFRITGSNRVVKGEKAQRRERDELYRYHRFSPKPDSTNTLRA